ncbi:unnamed protein product [Porites lobata]|uniref:P/Homo B domain-containing protein n=1 Tax=Porites lobata TaxID=104759 RepID=A0ABN8P9G2_9CNID|nr:unnamed protein product [Porites lobata]
MGISAKRGIVLACILLSCVALKPQRNSRRDVYSNTWVVHVEREKRFVDDLAERKGFINRGEIEGFNGHFLFEHKTLATRRSRRHAAEHTDNLLREPHVKFARQQKILRRSKRGYFLDPYYKDQWYLNNSGQTVGPRGFDINVTPVWRKNITGRGIVVTILDDGIEYTHPDLRQNYEPKASYDFNNHDSDPMPRYSKDNINKHGTRCAGEVAAGVNNNMCGVGVAYNSRIGGVRMLDGDVTDAIEAWSLGLARDFIDIYSSSWGPDDDGRTVDGPGPMAKKAFREGIRKGRGGLGAIFVWATGNGGHYDDYCNCDGYITSIYTVSIGAVNDRGKSPWYAEPCPSTLAVTYSSGETRGQDKQIVTTDLHHACTKGHTGTSAAAPLAAGIFALVLEANPKLSWRDLQHLIVNTSKVTDRQDRDWQKNGAGHRVNHKYGFGVLDTAALVAAATSPNWRTVPEQHMCREQDHTDNKRIPARGTLTSSIISTGCSGKTNCVTKLEHVRVYVTLSHKSRGSLRIVLTSPAGTRSELLAPRDRDYSSDGFSNWAFMTVFNWGENPAGVWKIEVSDTKGMEGEFKKWSIRLYGTCELSVNPKINPNDSKTCSEKCKKGCEEPFSKSCPNCTLYCHCDYGKCLPLCYPDDIVDQVKKECCKDPNAPTEKDTAVPPTSLREQGMSTFVKLLIIFILVAVFLIAVLIMWQFKISQKVCWGDTDKLNKQIRTYSQNNVAYWPVAVTPEVNNQNLKQLGNLQNVA